MPGARIPAVACTRRARSIAMHTVHCTELSTLLSDSTSARVALGPPNSPIRFVAPLLYTETARRPPLAQDCIRLVHTVRLNGRS
jgi:hypothetical protein